MMWKDLITLEKNEEWDSIKKNSFTDTGYNLFSIAFFSTLFRGL